MTNSEGHIIAANIFNELLLKNIDQLKYTAYVDSSGGSGVSLQLGIDFNEGYQGWQGRLVYVPSATQNVQLDTWKTWDALDDAAGSGAGSWFFTQHAKTVANGGSGGLCPPSNKCTWTEVLARFPDIRIHPIGGDQNNGAGLGFVGFKVGSGEGSVDANVDGWLIEVKNNGITTFDFEPD